MNTIIEKIRAEVERRKGYISVTHFVEDLLSFLSDLEKSEKPINPVIQDFPTTEKEMQDFLATHERIPVPERLNSLERILQEQPVDLDDAINNWQGIEAFPEGCGITPLPKAMEIVDKTARHFYELGRQSKEQPLLPGFENEQPGIPGKDFVPVDWCEALEQYGIWRIVRVEQPVCEELETEALRSAGILLSEHFEDEDDDAIRTTALRCWKGGFIAGASWQKEQMLKDAVETWMIEGSMFEPEYFKRKVIIIKEDK